MKTVGCFVVAIVLCVSGQDSHNQDSYRTGHHNTERQAEPGAQGRRVSTSGRQVGHSYSSSGQSRQFVARSGRPYYEQRPHVSTSGGVGRRGVAGGAADNRQTYDYPFGRGRVNYATHRGRSSHTNDDGNYSSYQSSRGGRGGIPLYSQQQQQQQQQHERRYYSSSGVGSDSVGGRSHQRTGYSTGGNRDGRDTGRGSNQGRTYGAGHSGSGQVYTRYHLSGGPNGTSQGRNTRYVTRNRYIRPGYGPDVGQRSLYGTPNGQRIYYGTAGGQRTVYGNTDGQRGRYSTGVYPDRTGRSQTSGDRTASYSRNARRDGGQAYRHDRTPRRLTSRGGGECPQTNMELRIVGLPCDQAVRRFGLALCYSHEFSSLKCCQACRPRRSPNRPGCEYGDRTSRCSTIRPADCYSAENRRICCQTCDRLRASDTPGCEYGDRSSRCDVVRRKPGLCYNAENQRVCCQTCSRTRDQTQPDCPWGDHNARLCRPFENNTSTVRINCYSPRTRNLCCNSCRRLKEWVPDDLPDGCEYGDQPVKFLAGQFGQLTCSTYFQHFSTQHCALPNSDVARYCCHTCHRQTRG